MLFNFGLASVLTAKNPLHCEGGGWRGHGLPVNGTHRPGVRVAVFSRHGTRDACSVRDTLVLLIYLDPYATGQSRNYRHDNTSVSSVECCQQPRSSRTHCPLSMEGKMESQYQPGVRGQSLCFKVKVPVTVCLLDAISLCMHVKESICVGLMADTMQSELMQTLSNVIVLGSNIYQSPGENY